VETPHPRLMNMHDPPKSYKRGPRSGLICQLRSGSRRVKPSALIPMRELYQHHQSAITTAATTSESDIAIVVSRPVDRPLLRVPAQASVDIRLATIVDGYLHWSSTTVAYTVSTLAANQFITTPPVWGWVGI